MFSMQVNTGLRLELLEAAHAEGLFKLTDSNPQQLRRWLPWVDGVRAIEDTQAFIRSDWAKAIQR